VGRPLKYKTSKDKHIDQFLRNAKQRARRGDIPFDLTFEYLMSITTDECPIFKTPFVWQQAKGKGNASNESPSLDKIIPELGYTRGNVAFISKRANKMKDDGTMQEHYAIADWIWSHTHARENTTTPVSAGDYIQGAVGAEIGSISTPWTWEDSDHTDDYSGATRGENTYHSAKEGGGDGMGCRGEKMATLVALTRLENNGEPDAETVRLEYRGRYLPD
jgi:hypothetical protein